MSEWILSVKKAVLGTVGAAPEDHPVLWRRRPLNSAIGGVPTGSQGSQYSMVGIHKGILKEMPCLPWALEEEELGLKKWEKKWP